jgi:hypothetical protein
MHETGFEWRKTACELRDMGIRPGLERAEALLGALSRARVIVVRSLRSAIAGQIAGAKRVR